MSTKLRALCLPRLLVSLSIAACATPIPMEARADLRACVAVAARRCVDALPFCARDQQRACMAERGWDWVNGEGYVRITTDADRAREIKESAHE